MVDTVGLVKEGVRWVGAVVVAAIVMLGVIAWAHDGEVATQIVAALVQAITWGLPSMGVLLGINQVANAFVASKQASQQGQAPAPAAAPVAQPVALAAAQESAL